MATVSPRQRAVLAGLQGGSSVTEIAAVLKVTYRTIYRDLEAARASLGAPTIATVLLAARDQGVITSGMRLTAGGAVALSVGEIARGQRLRP
jgi:DNA-binding NarL/FixJ family response regulator